MRLIIRYFFRTVRLVLTPIVILWDVATTPKGIERSPEDQAAIDEQTDKMFLYHFRACPFCIKVKREMKRLSLNIDNCDANQDMDCREALLLGGGQLQVPCLKLVDGQGQERWMYESDDIIRYLRQQFAG